MAQTDRLRIDIFKNNQLLNRITENVDLKANNWQQYSNSLRKLQKNVNIYLTELVNEENSTGSKPAVDDNSGNDDFGEDSGDEDTDDNNKRKSEINSVGNSKKIKA